MAVVKARMKPSNRLVTGCSVEVKKLTNEWMWCRLIKQDEYKVIKMDNEWLWLQGDKDGQ